VHKSTACPRSLVRRRRPLWLAALLSASLAFAAPVSADAAPERSVPPAALQGWWLSVEPGIAVLAKGSTGYYNLTLGAERFFRRKLGLALEVGGWYFRQRGEDAAGGSFSLGFRWHFWRGPRGSVFLDLGAGVLGTNEDVPETGLPFNFLPRAGLGATWRPGEGPARLRIEARWQHISNAAIAGRDTNPGRDALMITGGVIVPVGDQ